jgi:ribosomal protein S18 acetylase RimI-like enzyme
MADSEVSVSVRSIKKTDFDAVLALAGSLISSEDIASSDAGDPTSLCFVAEAEGHVVGFNLAHMLHVGIPLTKICVIQGIVVDDEYRRLGIGEKLVEAVEQRCLDSGINTIRTLVDEEDTRLQQFVEHLGFRRSPVSNYDKVTYA